MRKIVGIFLLIIVSLVITIKASAASVFSYRWENVHVEVPLFASIYDYSILPKASLYKDGKLLTDTNITYDTNGDWLYYLKDVNTAKPGQYSVWYKAYESNYKPGTCNNYKQLVTFTIYDNEAPVINLLNKEIEIPKETEKFDFTSLVTVTDNLNDYTLSINSSSVNFKAIGDYEVYYKATDSSGNYDEETLLVHVVDTAAPVITYLGKTNPLKIEALDTIDLKTYFKATDDVKGDVSSSFKIESGNLDYQNEDGTFTFTASGKYSYQISFTDDINTSTYDLDIEVVDNNPPVLKLKTTSIETDYRTTFMIETFKSLIAESRDNGKDLKDRVEIDYSSIVNSVGSYQVKYFVKDDLGLETEAVLTVNLISNVPPSLVTKNASIMVGELIDFKEYVTVSDPSDNEIENKIEFLDENFDNNTPGIYYINVVCKNSSNKTTTGTIKVEVVSKTETIIGGNFNLKLAILIVTGGLIIGTSIYLIIKKKKEKKQEEL